MSKLTFAILEKMGEKLLKEAVMVLTLLSLLAGCASNQVEPDGGRYDHSYDAPKIIESEDITEFNCDFITAGLVDYDGQYEYCCFSMTKAENGVKCTAAGRTYGVERFDISFEAGSDALVELQAIIAEADVASCNGRCGQTKGIPECGGSISVKYASGERIYAYDNASVPFPAAVVEPLCTLFEGLAAEAGVPMPTDG